ncbi:50S ribosomal protein L25 [endosymbiont of Sipalinus gigas]|uniref:50S ribosomal protein L25 n=1 Tax=endosymbiont of Sipalinus gigas TaxID=1972134 RepID=UPI000DC74202|nr:50S ribosomal protein L25 [endosymbiont of Sipalinus gigas]
MIKIKFDIRNKFGTNNSKKIRKDNKIPSIIYGNRIKNINIVIENKYLIYIKKNVNKYLNKKEKIVLYNCNSLLEVYIKEFQIHPIKRIFIHIDFILISTLSSDWIEHRSSKS